MNSLPKEFKNKIFIVIIIISIIIILLAVLIFFGINREDYIIIEKTTTTTKRIENKTSTTTTITTTITTNDEISTTIPSTTTNNKISTTIPSTTTITTTSSAVKTDYELAYNAVKKFLDSFYVENYIKNYNILELKILEEVECYNLYKNEDKLYATVKLTYEKINLNVEINENEELINDNNFKLESIFIINKKNNSIENLKKIC